MGGEEGLGVLPVAGGPGWDGVGSPLWTSDTLWRVSVRDGVGIELFIAESWSGSWPHLALQNHPLSQRHHYPSLNPKRVGLG